MLYSTSTLAWALALVGTATAGVMERRADQTSPSVTEAPSPPSNTEPCALASSASAAYQAQNTGATSARIKPSLALACLKSVALDVERDLALLNHLEPFAEWQSTLEVLSNPPEGYLLPGVDVFKGFGQMRAKLMKKGYTSQYEFMIDLADLVSTWAYLDHHPFWEGKKNQRPKILT
jgi:hypothetical protein